jgi:hypothetical protein
MMAGVELETQIKSLFTIDGRLIRVMPPGAVCQRAEDRRATRTRAGETLFVLASRAASMQLAPAFYERLAGEIADRYFETTGTITAGLREALLTVSRDLAESGTRRHEASAICAVFKGTEVTIARVGAVGGAFKHGADFETFPADWAILSGEPPIPLGFASTANVSFGRFIATPGAVLLLADLGLLRAGLSNLERSLGKRQTSQILEGLEGIADPSAQALVVQFARPGIPEEKPKERGLLGVFGHRGSRAEADAESPPAEAGPDSGPAEPKKESERVKALKEGASKAWSGARAGAGKIFAPLSAALKRGLLAVMGGFNAALSRLLPEPEDEESPRIPVSVAAAGAILVPVIVVLIVIFVAMTNMGETQFDQMVAQLRGDMADAHTVTDSGDVFSARAAWNGVLDRVKELQEMRPGNPVLEDMQLEALHMLDDFDSVTRRSVIKLREYAEGADLAGPVISGSVNIYTLDKNGSKIYHDTLNEAGTALLSPDTEPIIFEGQALGEHTVGKIFDIAWMPEGGVGQANVLVGLSRNGVLAVYSPTFPPPTAIQLDGTHAWVDPVAITTFRSRLYVLDPAGNQIWRYVPIAGRYEQPEPYFQVEDLRDISMAVDIKIDEEGYVYLLTRDGGIMKFYATEAQPFIFNALPAGALRETPVFTIDRGPFAPAFYFVDVANEGIYETSLAGTFIACYKPYELATFADLRGAAVSSDTAKIYFTSGEALYMFAKSD